MATVYILYSEKLDRYYTGSCLELTERLNAHRNKTFETSFTAKTEDWVLFFRINDLECKQSRMIERHIKKMRSKVYMKNLLLYPEIDVKIKLKYC
jgi:putative endonuclease